MTLAVAGAGVAVVVTTVIVLVSIVALIGLVKVVVVSVVSVPVLAAAAAAPGGARFHCGVCAGAACTRSVSAHGVPPDDVRAAPSAPPLPRP